MVPVRFRPRTITFMGRVRVEGRVSTRRGLGMVVMERFIRVVVGLVGGFGGLLWDIDGRRRAREGVMV